MTSSVRRVIGTRTGRVRHLTTEPITGTTGHAICGKRVRRALITTLTANCQKCLDRADLAEGQPHHRLSITPLRDGAEQWIGDTATCSCGAWFDEVLNSRAVYEAGGVGPAIVTHHYAHVIAAARAARATPEESQS